MKARQGRWMAAALGVLWALTHAEAATVRMAGGEWRLLGHVAATQLVVESGAVLAGTGTVHGAAVVRGVVAPGLAADDVGELGFTDGVAFDGGRFDCDVAASNSLDRLAVAGAVSGTATVLVNPTAGVYPDQQVIVSGSAASGYGSFSVSPETGWRLGESGSLDLWLGVEPGLEVQGTNGAAVASGEAASPEKGTAFGMLPAGASWTNTLVFTNDGLAALDITDVQTNGADAACFAVQGVPVSIPIGGSSPVTVVYAPTGPGSHSAALVVSNDSPTDPYTVNLAGSCYSASTNLGPYAGGNAVTFTNGHFGAITNVLVGGVEATIMDSGENWFTIAMPALGAAGAVDVVVQTSDNGETTLAGAYAYNPAGTIGDYGPVEYRVYSGFSMSQGYYTNTSPDGTHLWNYYRGGWMELRSTNGVAGGAWLQLNGWNGGFGGGGWDVSQGGYDWIGSNTALYVLDSYSSLTHTNYILVTNLVGESYQVDVVSSFQTDEYTQTLTMVSGVYEPGDPADNGNYGNWPSGGNPNAGLNMRPYFTYQTRTNYVTWTHAEPSNQALSVVFTKTQTEGNLFNNLRIRGLGVLDVGVSPSSGSWTGGYPVVISGTDLCNGDAGDVTQVTLAGTAATIDSVSGGTQIVVIASASSAATGDVVVQSTSHGETVKPDAFTYLEPRLAVRGTNGAEVASGAAANEANGTDFGPRMVGAGSWTNTFSISNGGNASLTISGVTTSGTGAASFRLAGYPSSVDAGGAEDFSVIFEPAGGGVQQAALNFANDGTTGVYVVNLAGLGLGGGIALETHALVFGATYGGTNPAAQAVGMTNVGISAFTYTNVITYSAGASGWLTSLPDSGTVAQGGTTGLTNLVNVAGVGAGTHSATVAVTAVDATNSPQSYAVTLTVAKASAEVFLGDLAQVYDGTARTASATTLPAGLTVEITYDGATNAPVNAGSYAVTGTIAESNYQGSATGTLAVAKAAQAITFGAVAAQRTNAVVGLSATGGGSGNPVTFMVVSGPGSITGGTNLAFTGAGDVAVSASQAGNGNYEDAPSVTNFVKVFDIQPDNGPYAGGNTVGVTNGFFGTITNVLVDGVAAAPGSSGESWFTIGMPAAAGTGVVDVVVQTSDNGEITLPEAYTYNAAGAITGVLPATGSWTGGYEVVVSGTDLGNGSDVTNVTICGVAVDSITSQSATQVVVTAGAALAAGTGDVVVVSTSHGVTVSSNAFEYLREAQAALVVAPASPQAENTTNALSVTGGSGTGAVSFAVTGGPGLIEGDTNLVATAGVGTITVVATKAQDDRYFAASVTATVTAAYAADVYLLDLRHIYDGTAKAASATTMPAGLTVQITYDGSATAPSAVGDYAVVGTVNDGEYYATATGTFRILPPWDYQHVDFGDGWCWVEWFGFYAPMGDWTWEGERGYGWLWHEKHGFFYMPDGQLLDEAWLYAMDMGWLWTGDGTYPYLYRRGDTAWLWYSGDVNPRTFYNFTSEDWEERP